MKSGLGPVPNHLHHLFWNSGKIPQEVIYFNTTTLYKNIGDRGECKSCRGISLVSVTGNTLARIFLQCLQTLAEDLYLESDCGFRCQRSTIDMIFAVRQQEKAREQRQPSLIWPKQSTKRPESPVHSSRENRKPMPRTLLTLVIAFHDGMQAMV